VPDILPETPGIVQMHAMRYRNPAQLPDGAVLVVGAGNSGGQIAEELMRAGRRVFFSIGKHRRVPRDYRGRNLHWWMDVLGTYETPPERRPADRSPMVLTGAYGGHTVDYRRFAEQGMVLLGRTVSAQDGILEIAPGLCESLAHADAAYAAFLESADAHVAREGLDLPEDPDARLTLPDPPALAEPPIHRLDLRANGIATVIWATGYAPDFGWIDAPVLDARGAPVHHRGVTEVPGLYFLGLVYLSKFGSSFLQGVGDDADRLADHIVIRTAE
jgi:putative flavoprotein involved in K+ transport